MKALQAQITPHFLYNTFDTIIWLAQSERIEEVIAITRAFSNFFRISLSKGHEWISVEQEIEHIKSYLTIQKIRYSNILDYSISVDDDIKATPILKFILQPLVENAIYHGIKNKRGRGVLKVCAKKKNNKLHFSVSDNGIGIPREKIKSICAELSSPADTENLSSVYGLFNVQKRLELYYNEVIKLHIESEYGKGTMLSFSVPMEIKHV
jgi:two-component system sensor histidine kinase YesM